MPNNPGRIDGDYSIGEREEVRYIDPGNFGSVRHQRTSRIKLYLFIAGVAIVALFVTVAFGWIL